jgi:hypothetical protein
MFFYTVKPFWVGAFRTKIKLVTLIVEGARQLLISVLENLLKNRY